MANTPVTTLRLDPELRKRLEDIAKRENRSLSNLIQLACIRLVEAETARGKRQSHKP